MGGNPYKRLLGNTLVFAVGNFSAQLIGFLMVRLYTGVLTTDEYGLANLLFSTSNLLVPILTFGVAEAVLRFALDKGEDTANVFSAACKMWLCGVLLLLALLPLTGLFFPQFAPFRWQFFLFTVFSSLRAVLSTYVRGAGKVKVFAANGILYAVLIAGLNVLFLVSLRWGISGYILSYALAALLACLHLFAFGRLLPLFRLKSDLFLVRRMLAYGVPLIPNALSWWVISNSNRYILTGMFGANAVGLFVVAGNLPLIITSVAGVFQQAWQLSSVQEYESEHRDRFYTDVFQRLSLLVFTAASGLVALCPFISVFLLKNDFYEAWKITPFLICASMVTPISSFLGAAYLATKKSVNSLYTTMAGAVANVAVCFALTPLIGLQGASLATLIGSSVTAVWRMLDTRKMVRIRYSIRQTLLPLLIVLTQSALYALLDVAAVPWVLGLLGITLILNFKALLRLVFDLLGMLLPSLRKENAG